MDVFWDRISSAIEKNGISKSQCKLALDEQEEIIIDFLTFNCYPDEESTHEIIETKKKILSIYTKEISQAISKIEVYNHDLDSQIVESIFQLVQNIACAELTEDIGDKKICYTQTLRYIFFVKHMVQISLSKLIFARINMYKKNLQNFNYKGCYIENSSFDEVVKSKTKKAKKEYKKCLEKYNSYIKITSKKQAFISSQNIEENIGLETLLKQLEEIVSIYEVNYPEIVDNGYKKPIWLRLVNAAIDLTSLFLLVYGFLNFFGLWNTIISGIQNLF